MDVVGREMTTLKENIPNAAETLHLLAFGTDDMPSISKVYLLCLQKNPSSNSTL